MIFCGIIYNSNYLQRCTNKYYLQRIFKMPSAGKVLGLGLDEIEIECHPKVYTLLIK